MKTQEKRKELDLHSQQVFRALGDFYDKKIEETMDNDPDSFNMIKDDWLDSKSKTMCRSIKHTHLPEICDRMANYLAKEIPYDVMLKNYQHIIRYNIRGTIQRKLPDLLEMAYGDAYIELYDHVQMAPLHWVKFERFSEEQTRTVYDCLTKNLQSPFNDERFTAKPIHANNQFGLSDNNCSKLSADEYNVRQYCHKTNTYKDVTSNRIFMDARLGLMFHFKNKPTFFISFFIDFDMNIHIRQIQGLRKGRGHYVLGKEWQKRVVDFVKERFTFANEIRVITEEAAFNYLNLSYKEGESRKNVEPILRKASSVYAMFNNGCDIIEHETYLFKGVFDKTNLKDKYYVV